jgi:CHAD domain-containing protein
VAKHNSTTLADYVGRLSRDLSHLLPQAIDRAKSGAIHRVRVTTRRLGSVVHLFSGELKSQKRKAMERTLRKLRRRLGRIRDLDVMLDQLQPYKEKYPAAVRWLAAHLKKQRKETAKRVRIKKNSIPQMHAGNTLSNALPAAPGMALQVLGKAIRQDFADLRHRADALAQMNGALDNNQEGVDLHALRISGKRLRYALELAAAAGASLQPQDQQQLKHIQDLLGKWHDQAVLAQCALATAAEEDLALVDPGLLGELLEFVKELLHAAQQQIDAFKSAWKQYRGSMLAAVQGLVRDASTKGRNDPISGAARKGPQRRK